MNIDRLDRKLEIAANVSILVVALLVGIVAVRSAFFHLGAPDPSLPIGTRMALADIDWARHDRTLVIALREGCSYCADGAPFYQRLARETQGNDHVGLVAVLPQDVAEGRKYLGSLGVRLADVKQSDLRSIGVRATPTLALVDRRGVVVQSWLGKLSAQRESEVLAALRTVPPKTVVYSRQTSLPR